VFCLFADLADFANFYYILSFFTKMIKYLFILLSFLPLTSFATVVYDRIPSGSSPTSPLTITVSWDDYNVDFVGSASSTAWVNIGFYNQAGTLQYIGSSCVSTSTNYVSDIISVPVGTIVDEVDLMGYVNESDCSDLDLSQDANTLEGWISGLFTISEPVSSVLGCMDSFAYNYNASSTEDDGSCITSTSTYILVNTTLKSLNFGIMLILVILSIFLSAFIFNQFSKKKKNFYD